MAKLEVSSGGEKGSQTKKDYSFPKSAKFYFIFLLRRWVRFSNSLNQKRLRIELNWTYFCHFSPF